MNAPRILLFTKTTGYRHDSIAAGVEMIGACADRDGVAVEHTEDAERFTETGLAQFAAVVWLQVSGDVLAAAGRTALGEYLRAGGGWAGIHAAADAERSWPEFAQIVGARFVSHPSDGHQLATVIAESDHPATHAVPRPWRWADEWYTFDRNPRNGANILLCVDESTYDTGAQPMGSDHPIAWAGSFGAGKTWYSALGHDAAGYRDAVFRAHLWGGITSVFRARATRSG